MAFPNISDILATTIESRSRKIADNVTNNNALLKRLQFLFRLGLCLWDQLRGANCKHQHEKHVTEEPAQNRHLNITVLL